MRTSNLCLLLAAMFFTSITYSQNVEVQGQLKVTQVNQNDTSTDVLVKNTDGTIAKRDANSLGVPSTGIVLSEIYSNSILLSGNFSNIGNIKLEYQSQLDTGIWNVTTDNIARSRHSAVWANGAMIIWGGNNSTTYLNSGYKYNPLNNSWNIISSTNAPSARNEHPAIWTGTEMIIWGGYPPVGTGARYNSLANVWTTMSTINAPSARYGHSAIWTGSKLIIFGGRNGSVYFNDGGIYDPINNTWTSLPSLNAPNTRYQHAAIWTGTEMIIWGGYNGSFLNSGARFNPINMSWSTPLSTLNCPSGRVTSTSLWTGSEMIIWGGNYHDNGSMYNPSTNVWTTMSNLNAPTGRNYFPAIWDGNRMMVWGGFSGPSSQLNNGGIFDPSTNTWLANTSQLNVPVMRGFHTGIWDGSNFIIFGGENVNGVLQNGATLKFPYIEKKFYMFQKN